MNVNTELIVLNLTQFGENSIVLHTLSKEYGRRSFLVRVGKKTAMALFLPMNVLEADILENPKSTLWTARNITVKHPLNGIRGNIYKNSMTMFLSEVLYRVIKDGTDEDGLFEWCERQMVTLDALESDFSNFHVRFLLELSVALGFSPSVEDIAPFAEKELKELRQLMDASFSESMLVPMSGEKRNALCEDILKYLEHHTESSINVRSLAVLRELFM